MNTNEDLRARLLEAVSAVNAPLLTQKANEQAAWEAVSFLQLHGKELIAALARKEEGREAIETNYGSASGGAGDGRASGSTPQAQGYANGFDSRRSHPAPHSGGEGDAETVVFQVLQRRFGSLAAVTRDDAKAVLAALTAKPTTAGPQAAGVSEEQIIATCKAAGIKWIAPYDEGYEDDSFPGMFDMASMAEMRALFAALTAAGASPQAAEVSELVPSWRDRADRSIPDGPDSKWHEGARDGMLQCAAELERALTAAGAAPEGWQAKAHELLDRLAKASPPNVLHQQLTILGDMAALLRCMYPQQPGAQHGQEGRDHG